MENLTFKIPLLMYSDTEFNPKYKGTCLIRNMEDLNISEVKGIEKLSGQYCWIYDCYKWERKNDVAKFLKYDKETYGFNIDDVIMEVKFNNGYYLVEIVTNKPLSSIVTYNNGYKNGPTTRTSLKQAIISFLNGCLSDGIGENPIGSVTYNHTTHEVWLGDLIEI